MRPKAPENAPNVLIIMTDDVGFGATSAFGGLISTPNFDAIAAQGLKFNRFHNTSMCSPTRAALLTGRNHHRVDSGALANISRDLPGYDSAIPDSASTIADVLRSNGYVTAWLGKNHNTPEWEAGSMGPFDRWPTGMGFDYFYGFNAAWADQYAPELVENTNQVEPPKDPDYILDKDLSDHAIEWLRRRDNGAAKAPFFLYLASGAPHTPHDAPADWIARYKGKFDMGWDKAREDIFARQKAEGVIPKDAVLTPRPREMPAWDSLSSDDKRVAARMMEVYAAQLSYNDDQVGRVINELKRTGEFDNTLIIFLEGDNGSDIASYTGEVNEYGAFFGEEPTYKDMLPYIDKLGGPETYSGYPAAWGWAMDTPFRWAKSIAGYLGGIRSGVAVSWPKGIQHPGRVVDRFAHVIDIAPTVYDAAGIAPPATFDGVEQLPLDGKSFADEFHDGAVSDQPRSQYFEMLGNFGFYKDGWFISSGMSRPPWDRVSPKTPIPAHFEDYPWELYDLRTDYSQSKNLAAKYPDKLKDMVAALKVDAERNNVLPVENDIMILLDPKLRPHATSDRDEYLYSESGVRYVAADLPTLSGHWKISAQIVAKSAAASGPVFVQGGRYSGWGLLLENGRPAFVSRPSFDTKKFADVVSDSPVGEGAHEITLEITPDQSVDKFGARASIAIDGKPAGGGAVPDSRVLANPAYLGRFGLTRLVQNPDIPENCECAVTQVRIVPAPEQHAAAVSTTDASREAIAKYAALRAAGKSYLSPELFNQSDRIEHNPEIADGLGGDRAFLAKRRAEAPDKFGPTGGYVNVTHTIIADGDLVAIKSHVFTKPDDPGREFVDIWRVRDGKFAEHWDVVEPLNDLGSAAGSFSCGAGATYAEAQRVMLSSASSPVCGVPDPSADTEASRNLVLEYLSSQKSSGVAGEVNEIGRVIADGDFVLVHHRISSPADPRGVAVADLFQVRDGRIAEHWSVRQPIPDSSVAGHSMVVGPLEPGRARRPASAQ